MKVFQAIQNQIDLDLETRKAQVKTIIDLEKVDLKARIKAIDLLQMVIDTSIITFRHLVSLLLCRSHNRRYLASRFRAPQFIKHRSAIELSVF